MKKIKNRIYFDSWRKINQKLFTAYISCYNKLSKDPTLKPKYELIKALNDNGILGKVTIKDYGSAYVPAREIAIFYNDDKNNTILGTNAKKFIAGKLSYEDYMKRYVLNYRALINNHIISPFEIIRDHSLEGSIEKTADEIFKDCKDYFSDGSEDNLAKSGMIKFIERAIEADLISLRNKTYKISNPEIYNIKIPEFKMSPNDFKERYLGGSIKAQENYVKEIIDQSVPIPKSRNTMNYPLNQILFGPPGTGKTYSTITKALDIIGVEYESYEEAQELFQEELGKRLEFVTMHQSFSYEDFVQGLKPKKSADGNGIVFDYKNGVFKEICERALDFDFISKHSYFPSYIMSRYEDELVNLKILPKEIKTQNDRLDYFTNLIDSSKGSILIKGPRDCFDRLLGDNSPRAGWTKDNYKNEYVWNTCEKTINFFKLIPFDKCLFLINKNWIKPELSKLEYHNHNLKERELKPHVIILDEINRANISRVFGELIALIEKDKRDGKLTVTLPSGEPFTVPSNFHIIGTMNTADKSIALVDIALRRRFEFTPLYPDPKVLREVLEEKDLNKKDIEQRVELFTNLNRIIRAKKSVDFEIGHSYFMEDDTLINILNKQVLPLLNEYFMYDLKKVKDIIEKQQKDREGNLIPTLNILLDTEVWGERGLLEVKEIEVIENLQVVAEPSEKYVTT